MIEGEFFNWLFFEATSWRLEQGDSLIFGYPQPDQNGVVEFSTHKLDPTGELYELQKAAVLTNGENMSAFLVGRSQKQDFYRDMASSWVFWYRMGRIPPAGLRDLNLENLPDRIHRVDQGSGYFLVDQVLVTPRIKCFADKWDFGGMEMKDWDRSRFLTAEGLRESLDLLGVVYQVMVRDSRLSVARVLKDGPKLYNPREGKFRDFSYE